VTLLSEIDPRVPMSIEGDRNRIAQIMLNFLSNAIKFSKNGRVTVKAESRHTQDHRHQITLSVVDSGIGITEEQLNRLFQDFSQADASIAPRFGGSGLGLSISKKLAELMGGRILVQSQYGSGSTFSFVFTAQESSSPVPSAPDETQAVTLSDSHPHEILVIDDNFINRKVAADLLGTLGYTPKLAKDGLEALALMEEHRFDIAFTDLRMPGMSGYELVRRIQTGRHAHIRCIAMTASATLEEKEKCLKHGMTGFVSKPIRLQELIQILTETPV
jgi:CheY-like chemotaxis protein